jgi:hypothetical protein
VHPTAGMRGAEKMVLIVALLVPVVVVVFGWRMVMSWIAGPLPQPTPEAPGAAATSVATARALQPTPRPTLGAPPTLDPAATRQAAPAPTTAPPRPTTPPVAAGPATPPPATAAPTTAPAAARPTPAAASSNPASAVAATDPRQTVASFYDLVSTHQFDSAAQLWSPQMRSSFPPPQNIDQRFGATQAIRLQRADLVSQDQSQATVAVDLLESDAQGGQRHYVGTWRLVRGPSGWMLDQPDLRPEP